MVQRGSPWGDGDDHDGPSSPTSTGGVAPAAPFAHPTWASARKDMVGASLGSSRLWFTVAEGIVTEVYYPRIDIPQIKDLGFIIADDQAASGSNCGASRSIA